MAFYQSERVETLLRAIDQYLPDGWKAVDLDESNVIELTHANPRGCPHTHKILEFNDGRGHTGKALKSHMKGKFKCDLSPLLLEARSASEGAEVMMLCTDFKQGSTLLGCSTRLLPRGNCCGKPLYYLENMCSTAQMCSVGLLVLCR